MNETTAVVALMGLPGAGKSRLAAALAGTGRWRWLDRDAIRAHTTQGWHSPESGKRAAEALMAEVVASRETRGLILDGMTLARRRDRDRWRAHCEAAGRRWQLAYLACPPDLATKRVIADRKAGRHPAQDRGAALVETVASRLEPPGNDESALHLNARQDTATQLARLQAWLKGLMACP